MEAFSQGVVRLELFGVLSTIRFLLGSRDQHCSGSTFAATMITQRGTSADNPETSTRVPYIQVGCENCYGRDNVSVINHGDRDPFNLVSKISRKRLGPPQ